MLKIWSEVIWVDRRHHVFISWLYQLYHVPSCTSYARGVFKKFTSWIVGSSGQNCANAAPSINWLRSHNSHCFYSLVVWILLKANNSNFENRCSANYEIRTVIRLLCVKESRAAQIHQQLCLVYGTTVITQGNIRKLYRDFRSGRTNVHGE